MKKIISLVLVFVLVISLSVTSFAAETHVYDYASLLSDYEVALLEEKARAITEQYGCEADIVTVYGMDGYTREEFDEKFINDNDLGYGEDKSCILLLVDMESRQYDIVANGYGNIAFTDYGKSVMQENFVGYLSSGVYYAAFDAFLDCSDSMLKMAREGTPFDVPPQNNDNNYYETREKGFSPFGLMIGVVLGFVIAFVICESFKAQMKTANIKTEANDYESETGLKLTRRDDIYVNSTFSRVKIVHEDHGGSSGGGGGTTINSGGFSHSGGSF